MELREIIDLNWHNNSPEDLEHQVREWAKGKVPKMMYPTALGANVWNDCRKQMIKNIERKK